MTPEEQAARTEIEEYLSRHSQPFDRTDDWKTVYRVSSFKLLLDADRDIPSLVEQASNGNLIAWEACTASLDDPDRFNVTKEEIEPLQKWAASVLSGEIEIPKKGKLPASPFRDHAIMMAVYRAWKCGLPEYSSGNTTGTTACGLVAQYMKLSPGAVKTIWTRAKANLGPPA